MADRLLVGTKKGLFTIERAAEGRWSVASVGFLGEPVSMTLRDPRDGYTYCALNLGHFGTKLHRSADGGATWEEVAVPVYPGEVPVTENETTNGNGAVDSLKQIWSLEAAGPEHAGALWAGTIPGGLFRSDDRGSSWNLITTLWDLPERKQWFGGGADAPGIHSICVDPRNSDHVTLGVSCGGVWETGDGAQTWAVRATGMFAEYMPPEMRFNPNIQDPHRVVQCPSAPEALWAQHHNGVFRSTDGAASWQEVPDVQPSVFGFAVAVHPSDPDTAWFVPAVKDVSRVPVDGKVVVVARTRNGGKSFDTLRRGLPQEHAYDLVYRHSLDIDGSGDRLAFGSTTGSLWVTEDQGDSWQAISEHLPPIFCVRFA
ncbi:MAG: hypothetical protein QOF51_2099 [Chloroflexota bacterium]|jgi:hypothetical protein|nr:hypothetical protein [Chloroflexota bacterium]